MVRALTAALGSLLWVTASPAQTPSIVPSEEIARILQERVDENAQAVGMVVGVIEPSGRRIVAHGTFGVDDERPVDGDIVFEIGSLTKLFTSVLLADAVQRGEVGLEDPIAEYLPEEVDTPVRSGRQITFLDLATQTSGLPRLPANIDPEEPQTPYADYDAEALYAFLSDYELPRDVGAQFEYSNLGVGLLGHVLGFAAGKDYGMLLEERVLAPLQLDDTDIALSNEQQARLATGHDPFLRPAPFWTFDALAGAGALRSTANDLLDFLAAAMGAEETPLAAAFAATLQPRRPTDMTDTEIGLAWFISGEGDDRLAWHNGITGGFHAFIGFRIDAEIGVVVLANTSGAPSRDIGLHLLDPSIPLPPPAPVREVVELPPEALQAYVGTYRLAPDFVATIFRRGGRLMAQATGQAAAEILPMGGHRFFHSQADAEVTFEVDTEGRATGLVLRQGGNDTAGRRVD